MPNEMCGVIEDMKALCASHFFTGAPVAQKTDKPLKSFAPLNKSSGAKWSVDDTIWHKKTPKNRSGLGVCASENVKFLRNLSCTGALVNPTHSRASKMSVGQSRHTRSFCRTAPSASVGPADGPNGPAVPPQSQVLADDGTSPQSKIQGKERK